MAQRILFELTGDRSPCSISGTVEEGRDVRQYKVGDQGVTEQDLVDTFRGILGSTEVNIDAGGGLRRNMPLFSPLFTLWPAKSLSGLRGVGGPLRDNSVPAIVNTGTGPFVQPNLILYTNYEVTVEFAPRPYPVVDDSRILPRPSDPTGRPYIWILSNGVTAIPFNNGGSGLFPEWWRWCFYNPEAQNDWITSQTGQMVFQKSVNTAPSGFPFTGLPRMFLPDDLVTFDWFQIPWRYLTSKNSYIRRLRGLVNQFTFWESPSGGADFGPGSLLYLTYKATQYSGHSNTGSPWNPNITTLPKLCNVQLVFLRTERFATSPPAPANANFVVNGHNALPWMGGVLNAFGSLAGGLPQIPLDGGRLFYYATTGGPNGSPSFISGPVPELLFQDPDSATAAQVPTTF